VEPDEVPEPCRSLLVHWSDMTSTLEGFYAEKLRVEVLARQAGGNEYFREVTLRLERSGKAAEFGASKVRLDLLPDKVRREILGERLPLGRILVDCGVEFSSRPRAFFRVAADDFVSRALDLDGPRFLYGRRNTLVDAWERPLAEIVEILAPA
jgi:chorismate-pyruvate lyase